MSKKKNRENLHSLTIKLLTIESANKPVSHVAAQFCSSSLNTSSKNWRSLAGCSLAVATVHNMTSISYRTVFSADGVGGKDVYVRVIGKVVGLRGIGWSAGLRRRQLGPRIFLEHGVAGCVSTLALSTSRNSFRVANWLSPPPSA